MVSSGHYLASLAGVRILEQGGNAIDAGVAVGLCLNVLQPDEANFGGVAPILVYLAERDVVFSISGLGRWPRRASVDFFRVHHRGTIPTGIMSSLTPAAPDAWLTALDQFGTLSFAEVVAPAIELAEGFPMYEQLNVNLTASRHKLLRWPSSRAVFMPDGEVVAIGQLLRQADLAATLRGLAGVERAAMTYGRAAGLRAVRDAVYHGEIARRMAEFSAQAGGLLTEDDLGQFAVAVEPAHWVEYRGFRVHTNGYWCQGPVLLQALTLLEEFDLAELGHNTPEYIHLVVEVLKLAFADREQYQGDPEFVRVPERGLLSRAYADERRRQVDRVRASDGLPAAGNPWSYDDVAAPPPTSARRSPQPRAGRTRLGTTSLCAVDRWGNAFAATPSDLAIETPLVPGLGFIISNRGTQSWVDPRHPSSVQPWKRPRLTAMPALVTRGGRLWLALATPGGDSQPQAMLQVLVNLVDFGMELQAAIEAARFATFSFPLSFDPHAYEPNLLRVEDRLAASTMSVLLQRGHRVEPWPAWTPWSGVLCAIQSDAASPRLTGAADPRKMAYAIGR
jgi:gamma-glutamyltranspeptidase/glutathione hydrolase